MTTPGFTPGPSGAGQTAQQVADAIGQKSSSSRLFTQMMVAPGDLLTATTAAEQMYATSYTIPANSLIVGQELHVKGAGLYTTQALAAPSQRARLRLGGQTMVDSGPQNVLLSLTAARYVFDIRLLVRAVGQAGQIEAFGLLHFATSLATTVPVLGGPSGTFGDAGNPVTVDTTQDMPLQLSCTFGFASTPASANTNQMRQLSVHTLKPVP